MKYEVRAKFVLPSLLISNPMKRQNREETIENQNKKEEATQQKSFICNITKKTRERVVIYMILTDRVVTNRRW